ncbi:MAG: MFS transporter [Actinobacteria bacterium]|nr:MFS transporter [Actinomycetota bacterium]
MPFRRYWELIRHPGVPRLVASVLIGRIPIGIFSLAIVLLVRQETHSFAQAGVASAAWALGAGVVAPLQGRLVDRFGQPAVLIPSTLLNASAVAAFVLYARAGASTWVLAVFAWLGGAALPPLGACMRSIWADTYADDATARNTAYTFESMIAELFYIVGPAITTLLIALSSPSAALLAAIGLSAAGTLGFATAARSRAWRSQQETRPRGGALAAPGMRTLMLAIVPTGITFGVLEVAMPAFAVERGHPAALSGIFLSAMAAGSLVGGLWYGARRWSGPIVARFIGLEVLFTLGLLPLLVADSVGAMVVLMAIAGLALAPSAAAGYLVVDHIAPPGTVTEATTWVMTANVAGGALGAALGGVVVQRASVQAALLLACVGPALGTLVALARRRTLGEPGQPLAVARKQSAG